ncbi:MAG: hypothetical protein ACK56I_35805, partial [bacterium]
MVRCARARHEQRVPQRRPVRLGRFAPVRLKAHAVDPAARSSAGLPLACGVVAALHVGKLPPAVPVLRDALGVTLVEAGFLLSAVQAAGMVLALALGLG